MEFFYHIFHLEFSNKKKINLKKIFDMKNSKGIKLLSNQFSLHLFSFKLEQSIEFILDKLHKKLYKKSETVNGMKNDFKAKVFHCFEKSNFQ